ncbi:MAG: hypothetical protein VX529_06705 [Pseudomonadota bacterium]|nr:hypothetical protein [Pseudomonadota bacterium]
MSGQEKDDAELFGDAMSEAVLRITETERFEQSKRAFLDNLWDDFQYSVIDRMPETLEMLVRDMADKAVEAMLKGQPEQVRRYLHLDGWTGRDREHPVIHGKLSVANTMELRAQVAKANETLLRDEVIKDLEDQVASLVSQINAKNAAIAELREALWEHTNA